MEECLGGDQIFTECITMREVYDTKLDKSEKSRIENLEIFDEFFVASSAYVIMIFSEWAGSQ